MTMRIPSLVGGIPTEADFVPSILCAAFFGLSVSPYIRRSFDPNTRLRSLGSASLPFSVERVVVYSLRAAVSKVHHPGEVLGVGCLAYQQLSFAVGYLAFVMELRAIIKVVFVNATLEDKKRGSPDRPGLRARVRKWNMWALAVYLVAYITPFVGYAFLEGAEVDTSQTRADLVYWFRYVSAGVAFVLILAGALGMAYFRNRIEYLDVPAVDLLIKLSFVLFVIPTYRIAVMPYTTSTVDHLGVPPDSPLYPPGSLTTTASKITFYVFHALPELFLSWFLQSVNIRGLFNTGPEGDWVRSDKDGIPRLRENGVIIEGVGVGEDPCKKKHKMNKCWSKRDGKDGEEEKPKKKEPPALVFDSMSTMESFGKKSAATMTKFPPPPDSLYFS